MRIRSSLECLFFGYFFGRAYNGFAVLRAFTLYLARVFGGPTCNLSVLFLLFPLLQRHSIIVLVFASFFIFFPEPPLLSTPSPFVFSCRHVGGSNFIPFSECPPLSFFFSSFYFLQNFVSFFHIPSIYSLFLLFLQLFPHANLAVITIRLPFNLFVICYVRQKRTKGARVRDEFVLYFGFLSLFRVCIFVLLPS